jgi:hypothetical protein
VKTDEVFNALRGNLRGGCDYRIAKDPLMSELVQMGDRRLGSECAS